jgi:hypothetical protein
MTWQQPVIGPDGALILGEASHPCVCRRSTCWKLPNAERGNVIDADRTAGNVAQANLAHRTDWSRPRPSGRYK